MLGITSEILFEKFEVIEVLKKDEHAGVYLANHIYLSKKIILKVLNTQKLPDQAIVERFKREAKLLAKLDHPNIIKVLDFGTSKEYFYISFEYIEGSSLRNSLNSKTLTFEEKRHLTAQLLKALHYAHSFQIIHRDIKPENIFIDGNLNLKLGDFGLALSSEDNLVTNPYSIVGTPSYMSPEQVRGAKLTLQSDLFSAGVVIVEMFIGKNPFLKDNVTLTLNEIMSYNESSILGKVSDLPDDLKNVLHNLLRRKPEARYSTALDALNDLKVSTEQQTISIKRGERKLRFEKFKITAVISIVVLITAVIISFQVFNNDTKTGGNNAEQNAPGQIANPNNQNPVDQNLQGEEPTKTANTDNQQLDNPKTSNDSIQTSTTPFVPTENRDLKGILSFESKPFSVITVDGDTLDPSKRATFIQYSANVIHTVVFKAKDYPPYTKKVMLSPGQSLQLNVWLDTTVAFLKCDARPYGYVYINNVLRDTTPTDYLRIAPPQEPFRLTIKYENQAFDTSITLAKNDTLNFRHFFKIK